MEDNAVAGSPIAEKVLRDLPKDLPRFIPNFAEMQLSIGVKELQDLVGPILDTADVPDLTPSHRAAACNAVCAIIESVQASNVEYARNFLLDDSIWFRLFQVYLQRSDNAKGKSVRQVLLVLTGVLSKNHSLDSLQLQKRATSIFIDIICLRHDRLKVKPALQGLAHFLLRNVVSLSQLNDIYRGSLADQSSISRTDFELSESFFGSILAWIVHHDTSLSASHLLKNYLVQLRQSLHYETLESDGSTLPLWIKPVVASIHSWPDRMQEFKTHVFPHCFLPKIDEYLQFLSYLHFSHHVTVRGQLPDQLLVHKYRQNGLNDFEEFEVLLAALQTGKDIGILKDMDQHICDTVEIQGNTILLPDSIFGDWLSHHEPEVRLAGLYSSVYSTTVTRPITEGVFMSLKRNLVHLHTDTDAYFRREILGHTQKLFDRLRGSMSTLAKSNIKSDLSTNSLLPAAFVQSKHGKHVHFKQTQDPLAISLDFIVWYVHFLEWELRSTSSYQRRITALRALTIVLRSGLDPRIPQKHLSKTAQGQIRWPFGIQIYNSRLIKSLLDLMLDPFDDVRSSSASILEWCLDSFTVEEKKDIMSSLPKFIRRAELTMLRTGRADQADGLARAYSLFFSQCAEDSGDIQRPNDEGHLTKTRLVGRLVVQLEETIQVACKDMLVAVDGRPVHGVFAALRYIVDQDAFYPTLKALPSTQIDEWRDIHLRIFAAYKALWSCIWKVLCADAPEGHIPEEMEEDTSIDTKEILSYSWRGLKEASILLRAVISRAPIGANRESLISHESFETLGRLCFTQLVDLRHRGAFSTVAQTFAAFCRRCFSVDDEMLTILPGKWYQETLLCIQDKADAITRRSAGIPALMTSIMAAEAQPGSGAIFSRAMRDLIAEASSEAELKNIEESRLPQVHAINCIKEVFMTSKLSVASEPYLGECLNLAAKSLNSKIWPIRNCSLVLFKALIERLLGSDEAQDWKERDRTKTSKFSYQNYPGLINTLAELLDPNGPLQRSMSMTVEGGSPLDLHGAEGVFPALQILRQAPPIEEEHDAILTLVLHLVSSPHWHLRDMAARTLASLYNPPDDFITITTLLGSIERESNVQHGLLLALKYIMKRFLRKSTDTALEDLLLSMSNASATVFVNSDCPFTKSAFIDLVNLCGMAILRRRKHTEEPPEQWEALTDSLGKLGEPGDTDPSNALLRGSGTQWRAINQAITAYRPGPALLRLSRQDPDSCLALLDTLSEIIEVKSVTDTDYAIALLAQIHLYTLNGEDEEVISKSQAILADSLLNEERRLGFVQNVREENVMRSLERLEIQCLESSPSNMQSALHLLGYFLEFAYHYYPHQKRVILQQIARYICLLRRTIDDENPFDTRFAAVQSLCALSHIWTLLSKSKSASTLLLGLGIVLYDLLNDDDDEIRDAAAVATTRLLLAQPIKTIIENVSRNPLLEKSVVPSSTLDPSVVVRPTVPIMTAYRLAKFLSTHFVTSPFLFVEALRRLTGASSVAALFTVPFATTLAEEMKEDNTLFSIEKRNLFKDDTLDTALWSRILRSMNTTAIPLKHVEGLRGWVLDGLVALMETARKEEDGALGWTSKAEVFTLGMRVICAAEIVLTWVGKDASSVKKALRELVDVDGGEGIHGLWVEKIERVLEDSVIESLRKVHGSMSGFSVESK